MEAAEIYYGFQFLDGEQEKDFFEEIYEAYRDEMYRKAYCILKNRHDAEDVVQETFVTLMDNLDVLKNNPPQKNWNYILTVLKNKSYNLCKQRKRRVDQELEKELLENVFDEELDVRFQKMERQELLAEALKHMNKSYRDILLLQYYHDMSIAEIARVLGKSPDNVGHMSRRAKKKLKKLLKKYGFESF